MASNLPPRVPVPPFDDADADITIRSSDDVDFRAYKVILAMASPVFQSMFTLPDTPAESAPASPPTVTLSETASTVEQLLRLCCPVPRTPIQSLEELVVTSEAVRKYDMTALRPYLEQDLKVLLASGADPLRAYAIACLYRYDEVLHLAARLTLPNPHYLQPRTIPPEFIHLSASALFALMDYRHRCVEAAVAVINDEDWMVQGDHAKQMLFWPTGKPILGKSWAWIACREMADPSSTMTAGDLDLTVKTWYTRFTEDAAKAVMDKPQGEVVTRTAVLSRALESAALCSRCVPTAWKDLLDYANLLSARIDEAVSEVRPYVAFRDSGIVDNVLVLTVHRSKFTFRRRVSTGPPTPLLRR